MDAVFRALADPGRRRLLDSLNARNGQTLRELCGELDMARQSVSKHLAVLEEAGLVTTTKRGREKLHYLDAAPITEIADRWIRTYDRGRANALADLKRALEDPVSHDAFVYTTYIRTTPEQLWRALTEPEFTKRYWEVEFATDWQPGSHLAWTRKGVTMDGPEQVILEATPYTRLAYTWHDFTPEFGAAVGMSDEAFAKVASEQRTKVLFEIEDLGEQVRLTVVHDGFESGAIMFEMISEGWPRLLSDLKSFLETGDLLPADPSRPTAAARWNAAVAG